jgi:hypothetical protein
MITNEIINPDEFLNLFQSSDQIIVKEKLQVKTLLSSNANLGTVPVEYIGMSLSEVQNHFLKLEKELQISYALKLAALGEAYLRRDYEYRKDFGKRNRRLNIHDAMKALFKLSGRKARLDADIIETWKEYSSNKSIFSLYKELLQYRHWIAHGRHWPYSGKRFSPFESYVIVNDMVKEINNHPV